MKRQYLITLLALALVAAAYWIVQFLGQPATPTTLAARALASGGKSQDRVNAVVELTLNSGPETLALLQRIAREAQDPEVMAMALAGMVKHQDANSFDQYLAAMDHAEKNVRTAGLAGVKLKYAGALPQQLEFKPDDPLEARSLVTGKLKEIDKENQEATLKASQGAMVAGKFSASPDAPKDGSPPSTGTSTTAAPTTSLPAAPSVAAPGPNVPNDYPAIQLLVWMCRVLAVLVLIAELAGALSLILGERSNHAARADSTEPPSPAEQMERILARMGPSLWTKIALLVAGAISIVTLLYAGEMIHLAVRVEQTASRVEQSANRLEQKFDYLRK